MHIRRIELTNFRNYEKIKLENLDNINIIIGNNGVGKTSILESIYLGSLAKTFKTNDDFNMIRHNSESLKVIIYYYSDFVKKKLEIVVDKKGKKNIKTATTTDIAAKILASTIAVVLFICTINLNLNTSLNNIFRF